MKPELTLIPCASIHPDRINLYNEINWTPARPGRRNENENEESNMSRVSHLLDSDRSAKGMVSKIARRKLNRSLNYLLFIANEKKVSNVYTGRSFKFKIAFITLTLPASQKHTDNEIKSKCLNHFLIEIKKYYQAHNYIWRAEKQKNGNLHFHLIIDKFIPHQELRDRWNKIINKLGYVDDYREEQLTFHKNGFRVREHLKKTWPVKKQREAYERGAKLNWNSPNTTDIHSVQKIHNIQQYISKYLTKDEIKQMAKSNPEADIIEQTGRIWGCNRELSNVKGAQTIVDTQLQDEIELLMQCRETKVVSGDYYTVVFLDVRLLNQFPQLKIYQLFSKYMIEKFEKNIQAEIAA